MIPGPSESQRRASRSRARLRAALGGIAALAGAAVLLQEILAAGWIAPLYGSGIEVWAWILATSLTALALGAWIGSRTAGRPDRLRRVLDLLALGAVCLAAGAWLVSRCSPGAPPPLGWVAALLLVPALALFGALPPWLVEGYATTGVGPGRAAGVVYALGTLGSAAGALLAGLVLVPRLGLSATTAATAIALGLGGFAAAVVAAAHARRAFVLLLVLLGLLALGVGLRAGDDTGRGTFGLRRIERIDGMYGRHEVLEDDVARHLLVDGILQTSVSRLASGPPPPGALLAAGNALELALWLRPDGGRALVVGLGAAAFPRRLEQEGWVVEAVEIDPVVVDLARRYFGVDGLVHVEDGRRFLRRHASDPYDLLVLDVYRGEHLPGHLFTAEAFACMRRRLAPGGLLAVNLIGTADGVDTRSIVRAVRTAFPHATLHAPDGGRTIAPMTLFASTAAIERPSSRDRAAEVGVTWPAPVNLANVAWERAPRLTDDRNPLPLLRRPTATAWRRLSRRRFRLHPAGEPEE